MAVQRNASGSRGGGLGPRVGGVALIASETSGPCREIRTSMLTGATDMAQLRAKGVQAYGFGPIVDETEIELHGAHSDQERMLETSVYRMTEFLWNDLIEVAATKTSAQ